MAVDAAPAKQKDKGPSAADSEQDDGEEGTAESGSDVAGTDVSEPPETESFESLVGDEDSTTPEPPPPAARPQAPQDPDFWKGLIGTDVSMRLIDDSVFVGRLLGVEGDAIIAARRLDGVVVAVTSSMVTEVDAHLPNSSTQTRTVQPMKERGTGMMATGIALSAVGAPLLITGAVTKPACEDDEPTNTGISDYSPCGTEWVGYLVPGLLLISVGVPLIALGARKRKKTMNAELTAGLNIGRHGARVGIAGRF
jgi:hypothetical protein